MLNRESLLFSPTREGVPSSDDNFYASDILAGQEALEQEARETLPFEFNQCTYDLGYIRQPLFSCLTCLNHGAVCAACSIACHGDHELVELFNRRHFRCDCGTEKMGAGSCCSISPRDDAPVNTENKYDANFRGQFCFCGQPYDPHTETDSMYQCLVCEDWIHHQCLFGTHSDDRAAPLSEEDFDMIICERCVRGNASVRKIAERYAARSGSGVMSIDRSGTVLGMTKEILEAKESSPGELGSDAGDEGEKEGEGEGRPPTETRGGIAPSVEKSGSLDPKRKAESSDEGRGSKKLKVEEGSSTSRPSQVPLGLDIQPSTSVSADTLARSSAKQSETNDTSQPCTHSSEPCSAPPILSPDENPLMRLERDGGKLNLYLANDWQAIWCRCQNCLPMFYELPYFLEEEEEYSPPEDEQAHQSTFDLGMEHLMNKMPRAQALDSIRAFSGLSDRIKEYLRPLAESGVSISKEHIESFFAAERERNAQGEK